MAYEFYLKDKMVTVDNEDKDFIVNNSWYLIRARQQSEKYYVSTFVDKKIKYLHRLLMGVTDRKVVIDHRNSNPLDCRRENIKVTVQGVNRLTSSVRINKINSLPKGVYKCRVEGGLILTI